MNQAENLIPATQIQVDRLVEESRQWQVYTGQTQVSARRMPGFWRNLKTATSSVWLLFFLGPYLRWDDRQAILFDIPARKFHIFEVTLLPQSLWMLALVLLFFAILLAVVTAVAGRVFCGFFCFQTVWTDAYSWIEEKLEGTAPQRRRLRQQPWYRRRPGRKLLKHVLWLLIAALTGISFVAWFMDAGELWQRLLRNQLPFEALYTIAMFTVGTYFLAGFLREKVCMWLCPYARIQGVMIDNDTLMPAYDAERGEPRGKQRKQQDADTAESADCIDCNLCVAVCPTGIDIRDGQQQGCITCALCIDACDQVMTRIGRPTGLIRYASFDDLEHNTRTRWFQRTRVWVYSAILLFSVTGVVYGFSTLDTLELKVIQQRQPLFVMLSDGSIQNRYRLKLLNKSNRPLTLDLQVEGPAGTRLHGIDGPIEAAASGLTSKTLFVRIPADQLHSDSQPIRFRVTSRGQQADNENAEALSSERLSVFFAPAR